MRWPNFGVAICIAGLMISAAKIPAQVGDSGTLYGTVSDASGAVVPGVTVIVTNQQTGAKRSLITGKDGRFTATPIPIGLYTINASLQGFKSAEVTGVTLEVGEKREVDLTLQLGEVSTSVLVSASAPLLEKTTSSVGQLIHAKQVQALPLNGRNFVQLGTLTPGAINAEGGQFTSPTASTSARGTTSLSVNGAKENANDWLLDGVDNNELTAGAISIMPSPAAIQEFRVMTSDYSAQYGRNAGGTVLITTKSGTNNFHGSAFEFVRNDVFDTKNYFDQATKPAYRQNQFGFSVGGPILKDRIFFFGDYQGTRIRKEITSISTIPTALMQTGNFSEVAPIFDPCASFSGGVCTANSSGPRTQFSGNIIPQARLNPVAVKLMALFPKPNLPGLANNFLYDSKRVLNDNQFDTRLDWTLTATDTAFARFSWDNAYQFYPGPLPGFGGGTSSYSSSTINIPHARNVALEENHVFSPSLVNQLLLGFNRIFISVTGPSYGQNLDDQIGIPDVNLGDKFTSGLTRIDLQGYDGLGDRLTTPLLLGTNVYELADNVTWAKGNHSMNAGFSARWDQMNNIAVTEPRGDIGFTSLFTAQRTGTAFNAGTGNAAASMLLGLPATAVRSTVFGGAELGNRWKDIRGYVEDEWRVTPRLTFNLGLAYQVITPLTEAHNKLANFDPKTTTMLVAGQNGVSKSAGVETDWSGIQPRVGLAYTPTQNTVVRLGYGLFTDVSQGGLQSPNPNPPFSVQPTLSSNSITPVMLLGDPFPAPVQPNPNSPSGDVYFVQPQFKRGVIQEWNAGVQQQLGLGVVATISYIGSSAQHLLSKEGNFNSPIPGPGNIQANRPYPTLSTITAILSRGAFSYNGLQTKLEKRVGNLYFLFGYTFSKTMDNSAPESLSFSSAAGARYYPFFPFGPKTDRGLAGNDLRHSFTASYVYTLPFGRGQRWANQTGSVANQFIGNWQINGISRIRSGFPIGATVSPSLLNNTMTNRPNRVCDPHLSDRTPKKWFNTSCFVQPAAFQFGNSPRVFGEGPNQVDFDFSAIKDFKLRESTDLQLRAEFFNILNTPQFDLPNTSIGTPGAASITNTINDSREIQFAAMLTF